MADVSQIDELGDPPRELSMRELESRLLASLKQTGVVDSVKVRLAAFPRRPA